MIEYVNSFLLLTLLGAIYYFYHKYRIFFHAINIVMDSAILDQLNNIEKEANSGVIKSEKGRKRKTLPKINGEEGNDIIEKRDRLITCVLSGNSKQYLGKEYTEQQINEMDSIYINILLNTGRYESIHTND